MRFPPNVNSTAKAQSLPKTGLLDDSRRPGPPIGWKSPLLAWFALLALLLAGAPFARSQAIIPQNRIPLFNGNSLGGLYPWFENSGFSDPDEVFQVENGMLHVTGNGWGTLTTNDRYRNYVMVLEFKWGPRTWEPREGMAKDSGLLFHSNGVEGGWNGLLMPAIQAQMIDGGIGDVILLPGVDGNGATLPMSITTPIEQVPSGVTPPNWNYRDGNRWKAGENPLTFNQSMDSIHWSGWDPAWQDVAGFRGQTALESPDGEWNQMVVIANNDTFQIYLNGTKVNEGSNVVPAEGKIQLEVEFAEYFVRRWELWPLGHAVGPVITTDQLPDGGVGSSYNQVVRAAGAAPLTWSIAQGNLPPGLALDSATGEITGTPTTNGTFDFNVMVADSAGNSPSAAFSVTVAASVGLPVTPQSVISLLGDNPDDLLYTWSQEEGLGTVTDRFNFQNGTLQLVGNEGGGVISTNQYRDYLMVTEYKWGPRQWGYAQGFAKNSGLLIHSRGHEGGHDGRNMPGLEVQFAEGSAGDLLLEMGNDELGQLLPMSMSGMVRQVDSPNSTWNYRGGYRWDPTGNLTSFNEIYGTIHWYGWDSNWADLTGYRGQIDHESPDGQWNQMIVKVQGGSTSVHLNGIKVNEAFDCLPSEGKVQLENEGTEFFVRRWELRPLGSQVGPSIRNDSLPAGIASEPYSQQIAACAGNGNLHWSLSAGALPPGLTLDPQNGVLAGTPLQTGTHAFTVTVTDDLGLAASQQYQFSIDNATLVTSGLVLHLDSTQGVTEAGGTVSAWADLSGNGNDLVAVNNPPFGTVLTPLGLPAVSLDGIDDVLQRTNNVTGLPSGNTDRTLFMVARYNSSTTWAGVAYGTAANNQSFGLNVKHPEGQLVLHGYGGDNDLVSTEPGIGAGWMIQSGLVDNNTASHFKNGTPVGQFAHGYNTVPGKLVIGADIGGTGFAGMDVAALLIYDRALNASERAAVEAYLRNRYLADTQPPVITVPTSVTAQAPDTSGAVVNFTTSAIDSIDGSVATTSTPASGSLFPLGTNTVTVGATDTAGNLATANFMVTVSVPIESWRQTFYGTTANSGNAADLADPYGTGIPNLMVFALLGPTQDPSLASTSQLPQLQLTGGNAFFNFTQPAGVSGITYGAEWSSTLQGDWQAISDTGTGGNHLFSVPTSGDNRIFMRLKATHP